MKLRSVPRYAFIMIGIRNHELPRHWKDFKRSVPHRWLVPLFYIDWIAEWAVYWLSRTSLLEFLEYCGSFSILVGVIFYFADAPERTKLKHYQAWQVINTAQGKGGSGGRSEALHELNEDHVPLVGVDLSDAFLQGLQLLHADLRRSSFRAADLKDAKLCRCNFEQSRLNSANLRNDQLTDANFTDATLTDCDLADASLTGCNLRNANLDRADLRGVDLARVLNWKTISVRLANIHGVHNAPEGFFTWAISNGAIDTESDSQWAAAIKTASVALPR